jgi:hypothetical protein
MYPALDRFSIAPFQCAHASAGLNTVPSQSSNEDERLRYTRLRWLAQYVALIACLLALW